MPCVWPCRFNDRNCFHHLIRWNTPALSREAGTQTRQRPAILAMKKVVEGSAEMRRLNAFGLELHQSGARRRLMAGVKANAECSFKVDRDKLNKLGRGKIIMISISPRIQRTLREQKRIRSFVRHPCSNDFRRMSAKVFPFRFVAKASPLLRRENVRYKCVK